MDEELFDPAFALDMLSAPDVAALCLTPEVVVEATTEAAAAALSNEATITAVTSHATEGIPWTVLLALAMLLSSFLFFLWWRKKQPSSTNADSAVAVDAAQEAV